jgi:hypothetical protein
MKITVNSLSHLPIVAVVIIAMVILPARAGVRDPFPAGFSMNTLGAIIDTRGPTGRQPWVGAAFCLDSSRFGAALTGTSYYGAMQEPDLYRATLGAWYAFRSITAKAAFSSFNALDVYFEETGFLSIGSLYLRFLSISAELSGTRMRCIGFSESYTLAEAGLSAWVPWSWAGVSLSIEHLPIHGSFADGGDQPPVIRSGLHTINNRFGSQGAIITVTPSADRPVCFTIGEEYRITPSVAFHLAVANNPVLIGFGMTFSPGPTSMGFALANHPKLGWSQGCAVEYHR